MKLKGAYPQKKALRMRPKTALEKPNSSMMKGAAMLMAALSA
jgi:hypothetical protein